MKTPSSKRPAFEPASALLRRPPADPSMPRPVTTTTGALLVVLRVLAGAVTIIALAGGWSLLAGGHGPFIDALLPSSADATMRTAIVVTGAVVLLAELVLAVLIYRGHNGPRVVVMVIAVTSISADFFAWLVWREDIELEGRFISLALDILILLALSSRDSAAYARRNEGAGAGESDVR